MIFVVDDDARIRSLTASALRSAGHEVLEFEGGSEALAAMAEIAPTLIISDILMPGMNGPDFVAQALELCPQAKVQYMSGDIGNVRREALEPWPLLAKPFTASALSRAVGSLIGQ